MRRLKRLKPFIEAFDQRSNLLVLRAQGRQLDIVRLRGRAAGAQGERKGDYDEQRAPGLPGSMHWHDYLRLCLQVGRYRFHFGCLQAGRHTVHDSDIAQIALK